MLTSPGLYNGDSVFYINLQNSIETRNWHYNRIMQRNSTATQPGPSTSRHDVGVVLIRGTYALGQFICIARQHDRARR